jgi:elongation factor Ts
VRTPLQDAVQQLSELAGQLAMHSAGMHTQHVSSSSIPAAELAALRADFASQTEALMQGKPAAVLAKVVDGKLAKWLKEVCVGGWLWRSWDACG